MITLGILPVEGLLFEKFHVIFIVFLCPCYISHSMHKEDPTRCNNVSEFLLFHIYVKLNMFRGTHRPSSGAQNCTGSLWFFIRGRLLDIITNYMSNNLPLMKNQRLPVQFWAPDDGAVCPPKHVELHINME
jgi:hypothetical protein